MTAIVVGVIILGLLVIYYYFGATYPKFNKVANKEFFIPGLDEKFVPQGLAYSEENKVFIISGYMADGEPSRIYIIEEENKNNVKYITLKNGDNAYMGHAGGVAEFGDTLWLAGDKKVERVNLKAIINAKNKDVIPIECSTETGNGCDFLWENEGYLIVGEFYHKKDYLTDESHHITLKDGKINHALAFAYKIDNLTEMGFENSPSYALSLPEKVQGITKTNNDQIFVSTSYYPPSSRLYVYNNVLKKDPYCTLTLNNTNIPVFALDEESKIQEIIAPTMAEEATFANGKVYLLFESASIKYKYFNRTRLKNVYSLDL